MTNQVTAKEMNEIKEENLVALIKNSYEANDFSEDMQKQALYQTKLVISYLKKQGVDTKKIDQYKLALDCLGLLLGGLNVAPQFEHVYWISYGNEIEYTIRREGYIHVLGEEGYIVQAQSVYKNDEFLADFSTNSVKHTSKFTTKEERGEMTAVYSIIRNAENPNISWLEVMYKDDIETVKQASKNKSTNSPWSKYPSEMAKKTVIRRNTKNVKRTPKLLKINEMDNKNYNFKDATPEVPNLSGVVEKEVDLKVLAKVGK